MVCQMGQKDPGQIVRGKIGGKRMRWYEKKPDYVWQKKRRRSSDKGEKKDRRRKVKDGIIVEDYERREKDDPSYDGKDKRSGEDRRGGIDRRKK